MENKEVVEEIKEEEKRKNKVYLWILLIILLFLVTLTSGILVLRIGDFVPVDTNTVFLVEKNFGFSVDDKDQVWDNKKSINIFKTYFTNDDSDVVIKSEDGDKVIAPGSYSSYTFNLKNTGNIAIDYEVFLNAFLEVSNKEISLDKIPIVVRVKNYNGDYFLGDESNWISIDRITDFIDLGTLGVNNYAYYTFEWKWDFEGDDKLDTYLGKNATIEDINLTIEISTKAKLSSKSNNLGGISGENADGVLVFNEQKEIGGTIRKIPFIILLILLLLVIILYIRQYLKNKKDNQVDSNE